jgi:hypothetical protein
MDPATDWQVSGGGRCLDFDGSNDYVNVQGFGQAITTQATVFCRFKAHSLTGGWNKAVIFPYSATNWSAPYYVWQFGFVSSKLFCGFNVNNDYTTGHLPDVSTAQTGRWYAVCGVFDRGFLQLYVDGELTATKDISAFGTSLYYGTGTGVAFGADAPYFVLERLTGQVAETFVYSRALSPAEIKQLYLRPSSPIERRRRRAYSIPAPAFQAAWAARATTIAGVLR